MNLTLRAIYIIWYRDVIRYFRDRTRLVASLAQPVLYLVIFGTGLGSSLRGGFGPAGASLAYTQFVYPGVIALSVLFTAIFAGMSIVWDREFGFLKEVLVAPINRSAVAIGKTLGDATQASVQGLLMLVLAPIAGVRLTPLTVLEMVPVVFVFAFGLSAMGVAMASGLRSMQGFQVVSNFVTMPIFFLSGALFPLTNLPGWLTFLTRLDPAAYGVDPLRRVILAEAGLPSFAVDRLAMTIGGQVVPLLVEEAVVIAFGVALMSIAILSFRQRD